MKSLFLCRFPQLFRDLDSRKEELEITGYGIAETTLEEVFLAATQRSAATDTKKGVFEDHTIVPVDDSSEENEEHALVASSSDAYEGDRRRPERLTVSYLSLSSRASKCAMLIITFFESTHIPPTFGPHRHLT